MSIRLSGCPEFNIKQDVQPIYEKYIDDEKISVSNEIKLPAIKMSAKMSSDINDADNESTSSIDINTLPKIKKKKKKKKHYYDNPEEKTNKILLINKYYNNKRLSKYIPDDIRVKDLSKLSSDDLDDHLKIVKKTVSSNRGNMEVEQLIQYTSTALENIGTQFTPLKLNGFSNALMQNESVKEDVEEIMLEYDLLSELTPHSRLTLNVISTMFMVHSINTLTNGDVNEKLNQEYKTSTKNKNENKKTSMWDYDDSDL